MLDRMRSFAGSPIGVIVFGALIVGLLFFGLGGFGSTNVAATVGRQQISAQEFSDAYQQYIRQNYGFITGARAVSEGIPQQVLNGLIQLATIKDQAQTLGMGLSDATVAAAIAADPYFKTEDGQFDQTLLTNYLRQTGLTEQQLVDEFREGMIWNQLRQAVIGGEPVMPDAYRRILSDYFGEQRVVRYAILTPDILEPGPDPTDEELATYFADNADNWQVGETREVVLLELSPRTLADLDAVTDEEIRAAYDARLLDAERRDVWQFVFTTRDGVAAADRTAAVAAMLADGRTFDDLVAAGEITPNDLGVVNKAALIDPAMADAAFAMEAGGTQIIDGRFGPTLVHVSEIAPTDLAPFEEMADQIRREIAEGRTATQIAALSPEIDETRDTGAELDEVGRTLNLATRTVVIDARGNDELGNPVEDLAGGNALITRIFESEVGAAPAPVPISGTNGGVWFEVMAINAPRALELAEVHDRVVEAWRADNDALRLQALADSIVAMLENDISVETVQAELGVAFQLSDPLARTSPPPAGTTQSLIQAAFGGGEGFTATIPGADQGTLVVQQVAEIVPAEFDPAAEQPAETAQTATDINDDMTLGYIIDLQQRTPTTVNNTVIGQIVGVE